MNINAALVFGHRSLAAAGIPDSQSEARTILSLALDRGRVFQVAHPEYELSESESSRFQDAICRRAAREPFHLIAGSREFFGLEFLVEKGVLIPRPETEILVEHAISLLSSIPNAQFFEIGVGTGCICVSMLKHLPGTKASGVDISDQALILAARNADRHDVSYRLDLRKASLFDGESGLYNLIVSNPPYIPIGQGSALEPEVLNFDPSAALFGGDDGLDLIRGIVEQSGHHLTPGGHLLLEIGEGQSAAVKELFKTDGWIDLKFIPDLQGIARVVRAQKSS